MNKTVSIFAWAAVALLGAVAVAVVAVHRGEPINAMWLVMAAACCYALGYRFYSKFIAAKILALDALRATPAERLENGRDFLVTNKWVRSSAITSLPSRALAPWSAQCWPRSSAIFPELCGYWLAQSSPGAYRTS